MKKLITALVSGVALFFASNLAHAQFDEDRANAGAFELEFTACTQQGHQALVHLSMTNYSPVDVPPIGYTQASKEEVKAVAIQVMPTVWTSAIQRDEDARVLDGGYLAEVAMEDIEIVEDGKPVTTSRAIKAMNEIKEILMRDLKYSGMGINYLKSSVVLIENEDCK